MDRKVAKKGPWEQIRSALDASLGTDDLDTWIHPLQSTVDEDRLTLYAPNPFIKEVIEDRFLAIIRGLLPSPISKVRIVVGLAPAANSEPIVVPGPPAATAKAVGSRRPPRGDQQGIVNGLPVIWSNNVRGISSDLARTALFTVNRYGPDAERPIRSRLKIFSQRNIELFVTGEETNTFDELVHMQLLHFQRRQPLGERIMFSISEVCEEMGLAVNGQNTKRVMASIKRLRDVKVELVVDNGDDQGYVGQMINDIYYDKTQSKEYRYSISFSPAIRDLFGSDSLTMVSWDLRLQLAHELSHKLHSFYSTHRSPHPLSVQYLYAQSGSNMKQLKHFRAKLRDALQELVERGFLLSWEIDGRDLVHVVRSS